MISDDKMFIAGNKAELVSDFSLRRSQDLIRRGLLHAKDGNIVAAREDFQHACDLQPTAVAWTYLASMHSLEGQLQAAINCCLMAIECDPSWGNPYNDIGYYLMKLNRLPEAVEWLEKAKKAARYDSPQFPLINLGKIYLSMGQQRKALVELEQAQAIDAANVEVNHVVFALRQMVGAVV